MASNNNNRSGGRRPNSPRYSDRYGPGHVNPYMGQPGQSAFIRDMQERQEAARRQNEENARRQREQEAANRQREQEAAQLRRELEAEPQEEHTAEPVRRRGREDNSQPRALRDPKMKEKLRQIQERAVREARSLARGDEADFGDIDFVQQPADVRLKLSDDGQPLIALETDDGEGNKTVSWVPVMLSEREMESLFPALGSAKESKGIEVQEEIRNPAKNSEQDRKNTVSPVDELVLIPIEEYSSKEKPAVPVAAVAAGTAAELLSSDAPVAKEKPEKPAREKPEKRAQEKKEKPEPASVPEAPRGSGLEAMLNSLPSIEIEPEPDPEPEKQNDSDAVMIPVIEIVSADSGEEAEQEDEVSEAEESAEEASEEDVPSEEEAAEPEIQTVPAVEYDIPDSDAEDDHPEEEAGTGEGDGSGQEDGDDAGQSRSSEDDDAEPDEEPEQPAEEPAEIPAEAEPEVTENLSAQESEDHQSGEDDEIEESVEEPEDDTADDDGDTVKIIAGEKPEEPAEEETGASDVHPEQDEEADDASVPVEEMEDTGGEDERRPASGPAERPKRKRRRSRPTDVQMPEELAAAAAAKEKSGENEQPEESVDQTQRRTAVAVAGRDDAEDVGYGQDGLFTRRARQAITPVFAAHDRMNIPRYIDDDDFVERWLGDEEEEDLASQKKNKRRKAAAFIGAATMILALIGFIAVAKWGIGLLGNLGGSESQKDIYGEFVSPVVMSEVPVFETWDAIPQDKLLQSAVFTVLMDNDVTYERDDTGKFIVPSTDIVNAVKEMYGAASDDAAQDEEINTQIRNALYGSAGEDVTNEDAYYVDMEDSFHVADNLSGPAPNVTDISKRDNTVTLRVEYLEDLETGAGGILYARQLILNLNEDGSYYVKAIREQQD